MRIGVSALAMRDGLDSGIARYCAGLIDEWVRDARGHEFVVRVGPGFEVPQAWCEQGHVSFLPAEGPWAGYKTLWELFAAGRAAESADCDVWFSTAHAVPERSRVPAVLSVQDLFTFTHPEFYTRKHRLVIGRAMARALKRAAGLVAISEHTRDELVRLFGVDREGVAVTPLGPGNQRSPVAAASVSASDLDALGVGGGRYLLTLSTVEPRKNLPGLFEGFARLVADPAWSDLRLVVAGSGGWKTAPIYRRPDELGISERVDFVGYVPDADLPKLFARCEAFVLPSIIEGFGLPLLEALAFGVPVACSRTGSLPEVGGDVPTWFDPTAPDDIERALRQVLASELPREEVADLGRRQASKFSWRRTADLTLDAIVHATGAG